MTNLSSQKIKTVIFDWGGVCCNAAELFFSQEIQVTLKMSPNEITKELGNIYYDYYKGKYDSVAFWRAVLNKFRLEQSIEINPESLQKAYFGSYQLYPEVIELIRKIRLKFRVGLLSNITPEMCKYIRKKHQIDQLFDQMVFSCDDDVAAVKPNKKPYAILLAKMKILPEECLFIDDSLKNLQTASSMGMKTILFKSPNQLINELSLMIK